MRFKPKSGIRRFYNGKELVVFFPGSEYHGVLLSDNTIISGSGKYDKTFKLKKSEVTILEYL